MAAPIDPFMNELVRAAWTKLLPLALLAMVGGWLFRAVLEKLVFAAVRFVRQKPSTRPTASSDADTTREAPCCPECRRPMTPRTARKGENRGSKFWGCTTFPSCRGTRALAA